MENHIAIEVFTGTGSDTYFFLTDERGNVVALTDEDGTILERYRYRVYGEHEVLDDLFEEKDCGVDTCYAGNVHNFLWGGSLYEPETDLYWMRNRYYHKDMHRFINQDPIGIWGDANNLGNGFAYVAGMVIEASDPTGLGPVGDWFKALFNAIVNWFKTGVWSFNYNSSESAPSPESEAEKAEQERQAAEKQKAAEALNQDKTDADKAAEEDGKPEETDSQKTEEKIKELLKKGIAALLINALSPWGPKADGEDGKGPEGEKGWTFMVSIDLFKLFSKYPSDPYVDQTDVEKMIFYRMLVMKLLKKGEEMPERIIIDDRSDTGRHGVRFFDNPYFRQKDPLTEILYLERDDAGKIYFNRFGKNGIYGGSERKNGYETVTEKGFNRGDIDPYFY
ncbi:MAG TPA: RHS repeat-associated core domain-containing protein [bacterium]|nr:RHS repeat-associated core domain-containing protein [bacterium]